MSDVVERARAALAGVTPAPWHQRIAPAEGSEATHAEWLAESLIGEGEPLHVLIAESPDPKFAYIVPAVTGDGPTSRINAEFIAAARDLVPELVAEVENLRAQLAFARDGFDVRPMTETESNLMTQVLSLRKQLADAGIPVRQP